MGVRIFALRTNFDLAECEGIFAETAGKIQKQIPAAEELEEYVIRHRGENPVPNGMRDLGRLAARFHTHVHRAFELRAATILKVLEQADAFRRPERFEQLLVACEADSRGRTGFELREYPQADLFRGAAAEASGVEVSDLVAGGLEGAEIGRELHSRRLVAIRAFRERYAPPK